MRCNIILVVLFLFALHGCKARINHFGFLNVRDFGAIGSDRKDDTESIQQAIDEAVRLGVQNVYLLKGEYIVSRTLQRGKAHCLYLKPNINLIGEYKKSCIKLADMQGNYTRILYIENSSNNMLSGIEFDGNKKKQPFDSVRVTNEHLHCLFINGSKNVSIDSCQFYNSGGDGLVVRGNKGRLSENVLITRCSFDNNQRNGISIGGGFIGIEIKESVFGENIDDSPIDSEPYGGVCEDIFIHHNLINTKESLLTMGGHTTVSNYRIEDNTFNGTGLYMVRSDNVVIRNNIIKVYDTKRPVFGIQNNNRNIVIENNIITTNVRILFITATKYGTPSNITFRNNTIDAMPIDKELILVQGANDISIIKNEFRFTTESTAPFIRLNPNYPMSGITVYNNTLVGYTGKFIDEIRIDSTRILNLLFEKNKQNNVVLPTINLN